MGHFDDDCIGFVGVLYCSFTFMNTLHDHRDCEITFETICYYIV